MLVPVLSVVEVGRCAGEPGSRCRGQRGGEPGHVIGRAAGGVASGVGR